ncbi:hypothetical protein Jiend_03030 [Micromonospora endophytica]|nr:hypothetical protein Jiend_03030 [Micromonospora endophytica]
MPDQTHSAKASRSARGSRRTPRSTATIRRSLSTRPATSSEKSVAAGSGGRRSNALRQRPSERRWSRTTWLATARSHGRIESSTSRASPRLRQASKNVDWVASSAAVQDPVNRKQCR